MHGLNNAKEEIFITEYAKTRIDMIELLKNNYNISFPK